MWSLYYMYKDKERGLYFMMEWLLFIIIIMLFAAAILAFILVLGIGINYLYKHGDELLRVAGRLIKWSVMMLFGEPEAAQHVKKSWRDKH